jgi:hypothetical protein
MTVRPRGDELTATTEVAGTAWRSPSIRRRAVPPKRTSATASRTSRYAIVLR